VANQSFGKTLLHFSYACDLVDEATFERIRDLILDYTKRVLEIENNRFLIEGEKGGKEKVLLPYGLATEGNYQVIAVKDAKGRILSLAGYAYTYNVPLWVVGAEKNQDLRNRKMTDLRDLWSNKKRLPGYWFPEGTDSKKPIGTCVLIPMTRDDGKVIGVQIFETEKRLDITQGAKDELKAIAIATYHIYQAKLDYKKRMKDTDQAFKHLDEILKNPIPKLTKPKIFFASSLKADKEVISIIKEVITEGYQGKFDLIHWEDMKRPGNIHIQLLEELSQCRFGICYFSEISQESGEIQYKDNANVLFEAGMLHGRSANTTKNPANWIPIREESSKDNQNNETIPFDLYSERMITVKRAKGKIKKVAKRAFIKDLRESLDEMVKLKV
jgi:hypothetical protein